MTTKPITQLDDAILYEMQVEDRTGFSWREIKRVCKAAIPFLDCYGKKILDGNQFIHEVLSFIENLENNGFVKVTRRGKFILSINLTERGKEFLKNTVYIDNNGMAKH